MAEPKKPEADNTAPEKATAHRKDPQEYTQQSQKLKAEKPADTAAETVNRNRVLKRKR